MRVYSREDQFFFERKKNYTFLIFKCPVLNCKQTAERHKCFQSTRGILQLTASRLSITHNTNKIINPGRFAFRERWSEWVTAIRITWITCYLSSARLVAHKASMIIFGLSTFNRSDGRTIGQFFLGVPQWQLILQVQSLRYLHVTAPVQPNWHADNFPISRELFR